MNNNLKVKLTYKHLKELCYWIILKFKEDKFHKQFGVKNDLLGGFIDRWVNKAPEFLIFDKLLENKTYNIVPDYFLYKEPEQKNSPDVIGLKSDRLIPFAYYENGSWNQVDTMPKIEVKTFRSNQNLITIPLTQFDEEKYYVIVESHISEDYLIALFENDFFDEQLLDKFIMDETFIESDDGNKLIKPKALKKIDDLGYYELLGIYKGESLLPFAKLVEREDEFYYMNKIEKTGYKKTNCSKLLTSGIYTPDIEGMFIPISIEQNNSKVILINEYKSYLGIIVEGIVKINGKLLDAGYYKLNYQKFNKTSKKPEMILNKGAISMSCEDSTNELINRFDEIMLGLS